MDDSDEDRRLPHHRDPKEFVSLDQLAGSSVMEVALVVQRPVYRKTSTYHSHNKIKPSNGIFFNGRMNPSYSSRINPSQCATATQQFEDKKEQGIGW
ncbi:hypothetical protein FRX31_015592 [Thalictrum thalictroides]|uniref:Uncharacterized protein n=1 Tax=Thalictrum thalictroides TaxID=46969 RepID=A0A7J6WBW9_THATH|nr:hypothetical protein FRX31_015592 [Thalictrum thalictroides]